MAGISAKMAQAGAIGGILLLAACQSSPPPQSPAAAAADRLAGTSWQIVEIAGQPVVSGATPTLDFADGRVSGNGSCNRFMGQYQLAAGSRLSLGQLASTMMACPPPLMQQEDRYLGLLGETQSYALTGDTLTLTVTSGATIRARRRAASAPATPPPAP